MKPFLFTLLTAFYSATFAADKHETIIDIHPSLPSSLVTALPVPEISGEKSSISLTPAVNPDNDVNLEEDVPGVVDNYFRFAIGFWHITGGWIDLGATVTTSAATFLSGLGTMGNFTEVQRTNIGIAAVVCGSTAAFLQVLKNYSLKAIHDRQVSLKDIITEHHKGKK